MPAEFREVQPERGGGRDDAEEHDLPRQQRQPEKERDGGGEGQNGQRAVGLAAGTLRADRHGVTLSLRCNRPSIPMR